MRIGADSFRGEAPRLTPRALSDNEAQIAMNARLQTGDAESWRQFLSTKVLANTGPVQTHYLLKDKWLSWDQQVDVARGLIPGDLTYLAFLTSPALYTTPRFTTYALATTGAEPFPVATRPLGTPPPLVAPTLAIGVDSTPTTFSIDVTDAGDVLASKWVVSPPGDGAGTYSRAEQDALVGNPLPSYRLTYDEVYQERQQAFMYRNFGIGDTQVLQASFDFMFSGDLGVKQAAFIAGATATGAGIMVSVDDGQLRISTSTQWNIFGSAIAGSISSGALSGAVWYSIVMSATLKEDGTQTIVATLKQGASVLATVTATINVGRDDYCGFVNAKGQDASTRYITNYDNLRVQASGKTGVTIVNVATSYVYTFVNDLGWESAPSPVSLTIQRPDGVSVTVTMPTTYPDDPLYAVTKKRIYRAVTGATGTIFLRVAEVTLATATYVDLLDDAIISNPGVPLGSEDWDLPNAKMDGIIALPNGIMAGFFSNQLCLSAQNHPHAWPIKYRLTTDTDIVAIANIDNTIVIGTKSFPYTATGNAPESYSMSKPGEPQSCVSKRGMKYVDGQGVVFPSPDGLQLCAGSAGRLVNATEKIFTRRQWQALVPESIIAAVHDGVYHFWYDTTPPAVAIFRPTFASMTYASVYQAAYPGIVEHGGTLDPATSGANVTLSGGNLIATFSGVGTVLGTQSFFGLGLDTVFEVLFGSWGAAGGYANTGPAYAPNSSSGGNGANSARYQTNGTLAGYGPGGSGPALVSGDVLGVRWQNGGGANLLEFWVNGVPTGGSCQWNPTASNAFPMLTL